MAENRNKPLLEARAGFESGTSLALKRLDAIYRRQGRQLSNQIRVMRVDPATPRGQARLRQLVDFNAKQLASSLQELTKAHVTQAARTAMDGAAEHARGPLSEAFGPERVDRLFTRLADQVAKEHLTRDGQKLEQKASQAAEYWKQAALKVTDYANTAHPPPAQLARTMLSYLTPGSIPVKRQLQRDAGAPINPQYAGTRLAETELQTAYHAATVTAATATPSYRGVDWRLSNRHVRYDVCDSLVGFHPAGEEPDKPHPHCRCVIIPRHDNASALAARLRRWQRSRSSEPAIEAWYQSNAADLGEPKAAA